jgi:hypothetical protein
MAQWVKASNIAKVFKISLYPFGISIPLSNFTEHRSASLSNFIFNDKEAGFPCIESASTCSPSFSWF